MAKGSWNPDVIRPTSKCRLCGRRISNKDFVRLNGIAPAHRDCAIDKDRDYTEGQDIINKNA